ncbi:MAG: DUF3006 domain-containing protein [Clostridia bacterium]|nr:DUF3006 domain-containing protein [Clostridia bacterium]
MKLIIDRFEKDYAVVEMPDGKMVNIPKILLSDAKEGDVVEIKVNKNETQKLKDEISKLMESVWE